jgi:hypothetical protein
MNLQALKARNGESVAAMLRITAPSLSLRAFSAWEADGAFTWPAFAGRKALFLRKDEISEAPRWIYHRTNQPFFATDEV